MITLVIILLFMAMFIMVLSGVGMVLLDPIIAILVIILLYRLIKKIVDRKKK